MKELKHFGLLLGKRDTDYVLGTSPIKKEVLMPLLDWKAYSPEHERQAYRFFDTLSCVTYSATDAIEYIFTYRLNKGGVPAQDVKWLKDNGYFKNGLINFSERFTAILGGTTNQGAYQYKVGDSIRIDGLIPQDMLPTTDEIKSIEEYLNKNVITQEMYNLGKEFIKRFPIGYEWAGDIKEALQYGPVQVCVYYLDGEGILCTNRIPIHAVTAVDYKEEYTEIDDSYTKQFKKYCQRAIWSPMLYTVNFKKNMLFKKEKTSPNIYMVNEINKTKTMIVDFPSYEVFDTPFEEVDTLTKYANNGTMVWVDRIIN